MRVMNHSHHHLEPVVVCAGGVRQERSIETPCEKIAVNGVTTRWSLTGTSPRR